jgi:VWFA-related protein
MRFSRAVVQACVAIALSARLLLPQTPTTIRTETRVVQIDVDVRDSHGKPIAGLTKEDFTVTDAGKQRAIQIFSVEGGNAGNAPAEVRLPSSALPPNVFSNHSPTTHRPAHATVILLDAINNYWDDFAGARLRMLKMVDKLSKDERIAVYAATTMPAGIVVVQDFTTDRAVLLRGIQKYRPPAITPAPGMIPAPPPPPSEEEARRRRAVTDTMAAFRLLSEHLGKLPGRKSLLWLTSGLPPKELREMPDPFDKAAAALNEANIAVHVMDDDGVGDFHRRWGRASYWTLHELADRTGGTTYVGRNDLENMLAEAIEEPRITYTLGFYLPDEERDDKFHPLVVRVNRAKLTLGYRKGYYAGVVQPATAPKKREPLENALLDPQDADGIGITAVVTFVAGTSYPMLRVAMKLGISQLSLSRQGDEWSGKVEEMFLETNAGGQVVARVSDSKVFQMTQPVREQLEREGVPVVQDVRLMEGATRLLIVVRDAESGRTGSLSVPIAEVAAAR